MSPLVALHWLLGLGALAEVSALLLLAALAAVHGPALPPFWNPLRRIVIGLIGVQVLLGLVLLAAGRRPVTALHLVYAAAAVLVLPVADRLMRTSPAQARWYRLGGLVVLLGVLVRLALTGGAAAP